MYDQVKEEIESAIAYQREVMPLHIADLISKAQSDLYSGPSYYDAEGEECSCFDDGAKAFDFKQACNVTSKWLSDIGDIRMTMFDIAEEGEEVEYSETIDGSGEAIMCALLGRELARYVS
jgi:hypothetical protein